MLKEEERMEEQLHDLLLPWKNSTRQISSVRGVSCTYYNMEESRKLYVMERKDIWRRIVAEFFDLQDPNITTDPSANIVYAYQQLSLTNKTKIVGDLIYSSCYNSNIYIYELLGHWLGVEMLIWKLHPIIEYWYIFCHHIINYFLKIIVQSW
jgi:hypothetical protein